jgi:hypothetical protein
MACRAAAGLRPVVLAMPLTLLADAALAQFRPLRYEDDFAAQRLPCSTDDRVACWKQRPLADQVQLSVGGDLRWRYEYIGNPRYGQDPQAPEGVWLQRHSAFADLRLGAHWRGFAQLTSARLDGREARPSPVDANRLDPTNLFVEWSGPVAKNAAVGLRAGIQELRFGSGRVIDVREGPNVRRSFDALRAYAVGGAWRIDAFAAAPRDTRPGSFDDARSHTQALRAVYATRTGGWTAWDLYAIHFEDTAARYVQGTGHERRWTLGARMFGRQGRWDWNWEAAVQGGRFDEAAIHAWTLATDTPKDEN